MPEVPLLNGHQVVRTFEKFGWKKVRQKGSHIVLVKEKGSLQLYQFQITKKLLEGLCAA